MTDPFAFMGTTRGSGRTAVEAPEKRAAPLVFEVPNDLDLVRAAWLFLGELNVLAGPRRSDAVFGLAKYHGFECQPVTPGLWTVLWGDRERNRAGVVAYLHEGPRFDLFVIVEGVTVT